MTWPKSKTALVISVCALLAGGITTLAVYEMQKPVVGIPKGWSVLRGSVDQWDSVDGKINGHSTTGESLMASVKVYRDVTISTMATTTNREASLAVRMEDADNGYFIIFGPSDSPVPWGQGGVLNVLKKTSGHEQIIGGYRGRIFSSLGHSVKLTVVANGAWLEVKLNSVTVVRVRDTTFSSGFIGLRVFGDGEYPCDATFSNLSFH